MYLTYFVMNIFSHKPRWPSNIDVAIKSPLLPIKIPLLEIQIFTLWKSDPFHPLPSDLSTLPWLFIILTYFFQREKVWFWIVNNRIQPELDWTRYLLSSDLMTTRSLFNPWYQKEHNEKLWPQLCKIFNEIYLKMRIASKIIIRKLLMS